MCKPNGKPVPLEHGITRGEDIPPCILFLTSGTSSSDEDMRLARPEFVRKVIMFS